MTDGAFPWLRSCFAVARAPLRHWALACQAFFQGKGLLRFTLPEGVRIKGDQPPRHTRLGLQKLQRRIGNMGNRWRHCLSRHVAERAGQVVLEKLPIQGMTKSAKGTPESPGTQVKTKADLNAARNILASGIGATARGEAFSPEASTIRQQTPLGQPGR